MTWDRREPAISFQLLICPVTKHSFDPESYRKYADGYLLTLKDMESFWNHYLHDQKDGQNPYAIPLLGDLRSLPRALIMTAEFDPLRDEGEAYAERLPGMTVSQSNGYLYQGKT
jgi:acetyl esterase